ncbi:MAG: sensor histidine kinase [Oligoflexales bacterium]
MSFPTHPNDGAGSHLDYRRKILSRCVVAVGAVAFIVALMVSAIYYRMTYDQRRDQLVEIATTHANFIGAVARFDAIHSQHDHPQGARAATLSQVLDAQAHYTGFGETGEYVLVERIGDEISLLLNNGGRSAESYRLPWESDLSGFMRLALEGKSGVVEGLDYKNELVLAAYQPVPDLGIGIVAKITLKELREPFIWAATVSAIIALLTIGVGVFFVHRLMGTPLRQIGENFSRIEAAKKAKERFFASVSHEIRNPANVIMGFSQVLEAQPPSTELAPALNAIRRNVKHLLDVVNDILDLSKAESDELSLEKVECSPCDIVDETVLLLDGPAKAKNIKLLTEYHGIIPSAIVTDPIRLKQVLLNVLSNAIKFTEQGYVKIITRARINPELGATVLEFEVEDTGIGMTNEHINKIFKPFGQAESSTTRKFGGTGIGLYLSKLLIERLGGQIHVTSSPGKGSRFCITLSVVEVRVPQNRQAAAPVYV